MMERNLEAEFLDELLKCLAKELECDPNAYEIRQKIAELKSPRHFPAPSAEAPWTRPIGNVPVTVIDPDAINAKITAQTRIEAPRSVADPLLIGIDLEAKQTRSEAPADTRQSYWLVESFVGDKCDGWWTDAPKGRGGWITLDVHEAKRYSEAEARLVAKTLDYFPSPFNYSHWIATEHLDMEPAEPDDGVDEQIWLPGGANYTTDKREASSVPADSPKPLDEEFLKWVREQAVLVHHGQFHQWKDFEKCTEKNCVTARGWLARARQAKEGK